MTEGDKLKSELLRYAREQTAASIATAQAGLERLTESLASETKSSAGDKFETGRAMVHMEQQKLGTQLVQLGEQLQAVDRIAGKEATELVAEGSLVATSRGLYLVGLGLGKVKMAGRTVFCTSLGSPIGRELVGKRVGEAFRFNELEFEVKGIV